jgi:hypothetical protein
MRKTINDRILKVGTKCEYHSAFVNGTGYCYGGDCVVSEVISPKDRLYRVIETTEKPREWIVQDINVEAEEKRIGDKCELMTWIVPK